MFRRREKRNWGQIALGWLWPRGGWARAFQYVKHRVRRLPDSPEKIARGIFAGVFTVFTPFYGLHFVLAIGLARLMRGNMVAALAATFVGNPLTFVPIAVISLKTGHLMLGTRFDPNSHHTIGGKFLAAADDLWENFRAIFTDADTNWFALGIFWREVFLPYLVGGIVPGIFAALAAYYLSVPVIRAYQNRRRGRLKAKLEEIRKRAKKQAQDDRAA